MTSLVARCGHAYPGGFRLSADFEVEPGITALVGASGHGKSTLVSLIAGVLRPHAGEIRFRGRIWADRETQRFLPPERRRIGVAFQEGRLFPHLTVRKNLLYGRRRFRAPRPSFDDVVGALEIGGLLGRMPRSLSGGQAQRVSLGRALLASEGLLLLDEPVSALDGPLRMRVLDFLASTRSPERTMVIATHDIEAIRRLRPEGVLRAEFGCITRDSTLEIREPWGTPRETIPREAIRCR